MTRLLCLVLVLLINFGFAEQPECNCYKYGDHDSRINNLIREYYETARSHCMNALTPYREKWELKYRRKYKELDARYIDSSMRYPDVYHNLLLFSQQVNVMRDFWCENTYNSYMSPGWAYTLAQKEEKIAKERKRYRESASICQKKIDECAIKITNEYVLLFEKCLKKHSNLITFHDYGMLAYLNNNFDKSLELLTLMVDNAEQTEQEEDLDTKFYHNLGSVCIEVMAYDKAVKYLSKAIKKDPENKSAYFDRALAYFETGEFDLAINDYLTSEPKSIVSTSLHEASPSFTEALLNSTRQGAIEAAIEFVPSMCHSAYGLGETLWTTVEHPIESTKEFANVCYEMSECVVDYCKNLDWNTVDDYVEQIKTLYERFDQLSEAEKGQLIGYTMGKYGVDIFAGGAAIKGVVALKKLKNINRVCNLEAMTLSTANKEAVISSALKHASEREAFLKKVKIHWDKQNKHIPGKHNFEIGKGTILIEPIEFENLAKAHVGTGQKVAGEFGQANYKERVDFGKIIGEYAQQIKGEPTKYYPTSKGIITYAKDGSVHVYPTNPNSTFN